MNLRDASLTLFFTGGVSLKTWIETGNIDRELELYRALLSHINKVNFVTYGGGHDVRYSNKTGDITILSTPWHRWKKFTIARLLLNHYREIRRSSIFKTNQVYGSEIPIWLKKRLRKPLITRCGYLPSLFLMQEKKSTETIARAKRQEYEAFSNADIGVVTSPRDREYVTKEYGIETEKIRVIPNYVPTEVFKPHPGVEKKYDVTYIGRGDRQKNLWSLLKAVKYLRDKGKKASILMIGKCCENPEIKEFIQKEKLDADLQGSVPSYELPQYLNQSRVFILPSRYEGHPKVLLEAMSCGLPCIGTNVAGIKDDITHLENGYLCETNFKSIADAIDEVLQDKTLREMMGRKARRHILENYSLDKILKKELEVIGEVLS
jgi:glycosyltransferase involved in cell wall biosynthesis